MFNKLIPSTLPVNTSTTSTAYASLVSRWGDSALRMSLALCAFLFFSTVADARPAQYVRPYDPNAAWNVPVKNLPKHPQSANYVSRFWSGVDTGRPDLRFNGYTYPVYYTSEATGMYTVNGGNASLDGKQMPWNPKWSAAGGSDAQVIVLDNATGREWNLWQVTVSGSTINVSNGSLVGTTETPSSNGTPADYRTKKNGWQGSRGIGIQYYAMLVQPEEIALGVVRHALSMPISNPSKEVYVAPATKLEHSGTDSGDEVPEGMRFAINITDAEINAWVATKPAAYQKLARTIAVALRDYGWFITDTSGADGFQLESLTSADALWRAQGIDPTSSTARLAISGLVTQDRIYTIVPSDQYPNQSLAPPNPPSGVSAN